MKNMKCIVLAAAILAGATLAAAESSGNWTPASSSVGAAVHKDPAEREDELGRHLMDLHLSRLAARQRGDQDAVDKLSKDIDKATGERKTNWKKLHPEDTSLDDDHQAR